MSSQQGMPAKTPQVFKVVAKSAKAGKTITYGEVGRQVGLYHRHVHPRLYAIWQWCETQQPPLPHLNAIVVNGQTGRPGGGYTPTGGKLSEAEFQRTKQRVFAFDWDSLRFPGT